MNLFSFEGRIGRGTYWLQLLALVISYWIIGFIIGSAFDFTYTVSGSSVDINTDNVSAIGWIVIVLFAIAYLWLWLALYTKRWHDRGKSGWWSLNSLVPVIGSIWVFIELGFLPGTPGPNQYDTTHQAVSY